MTVLAVECPPTAMHAPESVGTYGDEVADLAASVGIALDPEQRLAVDVMYAHDARGRLVATEFGCAAPRQNIKTHIGKASALADLVLFDEPLCVWTAHLRSTAYEVYTNAEGTGIADLFENYDHLRRMVKSTNDSDGEQTITLNRPGVGLPSPRLRFLTRSVRGGRGLTGRRVTFDEALFLKPSMTSAMVPILSAQSMSGAVQVRYLGSPGLAESAVWREVRDRGRSGTERRLAWLEWMAPKRPCATEDCSHAVGVDGCALDDPELVRIANLAIGRRMDLDFVLGTERPSLTPADYMRERLGWWDEPLNEGGVIPLDAWHATRADAPAFDPVAFGLDMTWDREFASIGWFTEDYCDIHAHRKGVGWVVKECQDLQEKYPSAAVWTDPKGPAATLIEPLREAGVRVEELSSEDYRLAVGAFRDAVTEGELKHSDDPDLDAAVEGALLTASGLWDRKKGAVISPLVAVTHARHGALQAAAFNIW